MRTVEPADAILAIDVGNSRIGLGVWDGDGLHDARRVDAAAPAHWREVVEPLWDLTRGNRRAVVVSSVNPRAARGIEDLCEEAFSVSPIRVGRDIDLPMPLEIDNPDEVGVDRVCCAAAAFERVGGACAVASFGTAVTVDCVSPTGRFMGGTILPGLAMSLAALHAHTAQLPLVELARPTTVFGRNTQDAILNGVAYGLLGALREIVERFATELREWPHLVITGGNAPLIADLADFVDAVVPDLCLMGVALAHRRAAGAA